MIKYNIVGPMNNHKYQRGKVYKIISPHTDMIYIGSTTEPTLARRLAGHKGTYNRYLAGNHNYVSSYEILQHPEYRIVLVESYPCDSRDKLLAREQHHIDLAGDTCVNRQRAFTDLTGLTKQDYKKQKIQCDCGLLFSRNNKAAHERTFIHKEYVKMTL